MSDTEKLFEQFPPVRTKEWIDKITEDLKGADFDKKLIWKTNEGFSVKPFYRREDLDDLRHIGSLPGEFPFVRGTKKDNNHWLIRQNIEVADYNESNKKALDILMKGVDSLGFVIKDPESVTEKNFERLLKGIHTESIEINFLCNGKAIEILDLLVKISKLNGTESHKVRGAIETDPLSRLMLNGELCIPIESGFDYLASLVNEASFLPQFRVVQVNASNFNNAGANIVQELSFGLSMANEYMSQLTERGINADVAASKIRFSFGIGSNYFLEIAKLRAARLLWSVIAGAYKPEITDSLRMEIHCITSRWNKTIYDPYVNMLRTQTEAMSASLGGADSLTIEPFDTVFKLPDGFSERIARNQQLLLKEESHFDLVADPAAGSYYVENLTSLIAEHAWNMFLDIEDKGSFMSALKEGYIQEKLNETAAKRKEDVARRKEVLLGTNLYPDSNESVSSEVDINKVFTSPAGGTDNLIETVKLFRGAEEYEKLRIFTDLRARKPTAFMLTVGNPQLRKVRSHFACDFFTCGGYKVIDNDGFQTVEEGVQAAMNAHSDIIVICSSDEEYATIAPQILEKIKNKTLVVVVGNRECMDKLKSKGIENFISEQSNVPEALKFFNKKPGAVR